MAELTQERLKEIREHKDRAFDMVSALCKPRGTEGSREWIMSIPARPDHDPDLVIGAALKDIDALLAHIDAQAEEIERLRQDLAYVKENAEFLRSSVGECHLMISRNSSEFQTQGKQWRLSDLPARLQRIMRERETLAEAVRAREEARRTAISPYRPSSEPVSETLRLERLHSEACKRDEAAHQKALALLDGGQDGGGK